MNKKIIITGVVLVILASISVFAKAPNSFKYQTIVRNTSGAIIANQDVSFQISIIQGTASGTLVYVETHDVSTNEFGLVNLSIGSGTSSNDFTLIDWSNGPYFIKVELDENGDSDYSETALRFQPVCLIDSDRLD